MKKILPPIVLLAALSPLCSAFTQTETGSQGKSAAEKTAPESSKKSGSDKSLRAQKTSAARDFTGQSGPGDGEEKAVGAEARRAANDNPAPENKASEARKYYESGITLLESGKLDEAIEKLRQSVKLEPGNAQAQYSLGMAYSRSNKYEEATESFKRATHFKPEWAEPHYRLGLMYYVLDKRNSALEEYKKLLTLNLPLANGLGRLLKDDANTISPDGAVSDAAVVSQPSSLSKKDEPKRETSVSGSASKKESSKATDSGSAGDDQRSTAEPKESQNSAPDVSGPAVVGNATSAITGSDETALLNTYRVGVGDVLDIRVLSSSLNRSTLYTVVDGGVIEMPMVGGSMAVGGLTTDEIRARLAAELQRRGVQENAQLSVGVRQYTSHTVIVAGLVGFPGTKTLRREAVPLYVVLAEAQPHHDAGRATIMRAGSLGLTVDLADQSSLNLLIRPGDVINLSTRPQDFYYIAGRVNLPGQKVFQSGITLLQAILAAGGLVRQSDNTVELSREGGGGRLVTTRYKLKEIKSGSVKDPRLQPGDRIEVVH